MLFRQFMSPNRVHHEFLAKGQRVLLRPMSTDDLDRLLVFINELVEEKRQGKGSEVFTGFENKVARREEIDWLAARMVQIENDELVSVLADVSGRVVANGGIERGHYRETRHHGELGLTVLSAYRGVGIGREMIKVLLAEARRIGLRNVAVEFLSASQAAIHAYQSAGFREVGRIPGKVDRNGKLIDSLIMAREI